MIEHTKAFVDGAWVTASSGEEFAVINPASGDALLESLISPLGMPYALLMRLIGRSLVGPNCLPVIGQES